MTPRQHGYNRVHKVAGLKIERPHQADLIGTRAFGVDPLTHFNEKTAMSDADMVTLLGALGGPFGLAGAAAPAIGAGSAHAPGERMAPSLGAYGGGLLGSGIGGVLGLLGGGALGHVAADLYQDYNEPSILDKLLLRDRRQRDTAMIAGALGGSVLGSMAGGGLGARAGYGAMTE